MVTLLESTNNFVKHFYAGQDKSTNCLSKRGTKLREYINTHQPDKPMKPFHVQYMEWVEKNPDQKVTETTAPAPAPVATPPQNDEEIETLKRQVAHFQKARDNVMTKLLQQKEEYNDLEHKYACLEERHEVFVSDYKEKCHEYNKVCLLLEEKGMSKQHIEDFHHFKSAYNTCSCRMMKPK